MSTSVLAGQHILVVEDEYFLADALESALRRLEAVVIGPVPSVAAAIDAIELRAPELAVLDYNLGGEMAHTVADALLSRNVPFLFTTGFDQATLPERFAAVSRLQKPFETRTVVSELERLLGRRPSAQSEAETPIAPRR